MQARPDKARRALPAWAHSWSLKLENMILVASRTRSCSLRGEGRSVYGTKPAQVDRKLRLKLGIAALVLLAVCLASPLCALFVKMWVDMFAVGDSFTKVYLLLLLAGLVLLSPDLPFDKRTARATSLLLGFLLLLSLGQHSWVMDSLGLGIKNQIGVVFAGDYSTTRLDHIHVPKAALGLMLSGMSYRFDAGLPFQQFFPPYLLWSQLLLLLLLSLGTFVVLVNSRSRKSGSEFTLDFLIWFIGVKATVDGGPLNSEFVAVLPFLLATVWTGSWRRFGLLLWPSYFVFAFWLPGSHLLRLFHFVSTLLAIGATVLVIKRPRWGIGLLLACILLLSPLRNTLDSDLAESNHAWNVLNWLCRPLEPGDVVYVTSSADLHSNELAEILETHTALPYRVASVRILRPTTVFQLSRGLGLYVARRPVRFAPQVAQKADVAVWQPGWVKGDFRNLELDLPAGAGVNYLVAQMKPGTAFRRFRFRPSYTPSEPLPE